MSEEQWSDWFQHDGGRCPLPEGAIVQVLWNRCGQYVFKGPYATRGPLAENWHLVIRYRIRKPRGLTILENLIADLPAPARKVDA